MIRIYTDTQYATGVGEGDSLEEDIHALPRLGEGKRAPDDLGRGDRCDGDSDATRSLLLALAGMCARLRIERPLNCA